MATLAKATHKLFVHNLPWTVNAQKLRIYFSKFGKVNSAHIVFDKNTGLSRGYGFIIFNNQIASDAATNTPKHFLEGNFVSLQKANK
ncbi:heterogeneous nuclear ribonucleoprotein A/B-like [Rhodnius prolixus]|uniref:heterogeneous nuclear ribonucleoprotein A/B-like n=1 Tax=Rhodnius prolixus TaxID=13249 RepID=UPI003D189A9D